jgi:3',5'-cyclic-AMP phosphodiesterase
MKKYIAAIIVIVFAFFAFRVFAQSSDSGLLFSFRGVLFGILKEAEGIAAKIASPFARSEAAPVTPTRQTDEGNFSFAIIGDTQYFKVENPNGYFQKVVKDITAANPNLVIATGDLTGSCESYSECIDKHNAWKKIDAPLLSKTYATMGNHDNINNKGGKAWQDAFDFPTNGPASFSEQVYSFDYKNSHFVVLNSDSPKEHLVNGEERSWLEKDLAANKKENTFAVFHEPAYPVSSKVGESLDKSSAERDALWQILEKNNVTAVFNGHEHIVSRRKIGSTYQFVFGSTDSFDHDLPDPGIAEYANRGQGRFGMVSVSGKEITVKTYSSDNQELNSFTFTK